MPKGIYIRTEKHKLALKVPSPGSGVYKRTSKHGAAISAAKIVFQKLIPEAKLCECGCLEYAKPGKRFINGHSRRNKKHSEKTILKISEAKTGVFLSPKHCVAIKEALNKPDVKAKKSVSQKGISKSSEHIVAIKEGHNTPEYLENNSGKNSSSWQGGISFLPYPSGWTRTLKESIRQRDSYVCQLCNKTQEENGRKLDVHHIDYVKENLDPKNLTALCRSCNTKVNGNREYWMKFFQEKLG